MEVGREMMMKEGRSQGRSQGRSVCSTGQGKAREDLDWGAGAAPGGEEKRPRVLGKAAPKTLVTD